MIPKSPREWLDQVKLGIRYRDSFDRKARWQRNYDWFMGKYAAGIIPVNIVFGIARGLIPQIYFKSPTIVNRPRPADPQLYAERMLNAKVLDAIDSYLIQQLALKKTLKLIILDAFLYNVGIVKVGYHSLETELQPQDNDTEDVLVAMEELTGAAPEQDKTQRDWYSYHDLVKPNMPWALRVSPKDFVVPATAKTIEESPWCAFRFVRRLDEIMASNVYPMRLKRGLRANAKATIDGEALQVPQQRSMPGISADDEYVEGWEIWDKRTGTITAIAEGHSKFLRDEEHGLEIDCLPVEILQLNQVGDDFWGISHCDAIAPQVDEYNETRTHEMYHRKMCSLKLLIDRNLLKPEEILKLQNGDVGPVILTEGSPTAGYAALVPTMSRDIYKVADDIFNDIRAIIGYNRNQGGEFESSRRTATEVSRVAQQNMIRDDELRDLVGDLIASLFQNKIHPIIFQNWTQQRSFEVTSMQGGWINVVPSRIRGNYDVQVVPDSTLPMSKDMAKAQAGELFKVLNNDPYIRQDALRKQFLEKYEGIKIEELMKTPEEMQKEQQEQMKVMLLKAALEHGAAGGNVKPLAPKQENKSAKVA